MATAIDTLNTQTQASTAKATNASRFSDLSSEQFTKIMFSELKNQDPLKPNDSNQLLQQIANLRSIESNLSMEGKLKSLVSQNQLSTAGSMIGASISGLSDANERVNGIVGSVSRTASGPVLLLKSGVRVPFEQVDTITLPDSSTPPTPPTTPVTPPVVTVPPVVTPAPGTTNPATTTNPALGSPRTITPVAATSGGSPT